MDFLPGLNSFYLPALCGFMSPGQAGNCQARGGLRQEARFYGRLSLRAGSDPRPSGAAFRARADRSGRRCRRILGAFARQKRARRAAPNTRGLRAGRPYRDCVFMLERFAGIRHRSQAKPVAGAAGRAAHAALPGAGLMLAGALLAACSSSGNTSFSLFVDPGKYQFYSCEQIAPELKRWTTRAQELKTLMDRADQGAGGAAVGFIAYKAEYVAANEEIDMLRSTARGKSCEQDPGWRSNTAIR
jgi:hypothetical protein